MPWTESDDSLSALESTYVSRFVKIPLEPFCPLPSRGSGLRRFTSLRTTKIFEAREKCFGSISPIYDSSDRSTSLRGVASSFSDCLCLLKHNRLVFLPSTIRLRVRSDRAAMSIHALVMPKKWRRKLFEARRAE